ncbi:putative immune-type receptor 10a isoform X3 [Siphateles boraxobius]|uniref:putative immune-type receptor 10a isoform X3 n=1 Tax=Siphateles boraxobius TaxID=180520 RepID=UPI004062F998
MLRISTAALLLFGTGFLQVMFSIASINAQPGQNVTMWCAHDIHVSGNLYWFKQKNGDVPITVVYMLYTESLQKTEPKYFNTFTKDQIVMNLFSKGTTLTIKHASISDSGFYFCGATGYHMKFGNGTRLEVKDDEKSPVTEECPRDIFFMLTFIFGGFIFFTCITPLLLAIIRQHKRQKHKKAAECQTQQHDDKETDSVEYAAVYFSNRRSKTAGRHTEDSTVLYTDST